MKRHKFEYLPIILRRIVRPADREATPDFSQPLAFWPLRGGRGEPAALHQWDGRIKLCVGRIQNDPVFLKLFGSETSAIAALCQYELLLELNSYLGVDEKHSPASVEYMKRTYPKANFIFRPSLIAFSFENITDLALKLLMEIRRGNTAFFKPLMFDESLAQFFANGDEGIFARCLQQLAEAKKQLARERGRMWDFPIPWPQEIADAIEKERVPQAESARR